jgi:GH15 family glucan-1,4-alpha-glucosidase
MRFELIIRFDYGSIVPWVRRTKDGIAAIGGPDALRLWSPVPLAGANFKHCAEFTVVEGQRLPFVLIWHESYRDAPSLIDPLEALRATDSWWRDWSQRCCCQTAYPDAVLRSLLTLKALTYAPSGGIVAAATTSLPEQLGGVRNWDYRFCWLRDATFTLYALLEAGYRDEAEAWRSWLLRAVAGRPSSTNIMYGLCGERRLTELELEWLPGYEGAKPVRVGNAASRQFQLDVYGEVLDTLYFSRKKGLADDQDGWRVERALVKFVESGAREPDEGIWEVRGPRRHFTHSKVMAWVALDRAVRSVTEFGLDGPVERWRKRRDEIHAEICRAGFNSRIGAFVQSYDADQLDASVLIMPLVGFLPVNDNRIKGTVAAIERNLMRDGFVKRYDSSRTEDGLPPGEGAFLPCTFWLADCYSLMGRDVEARELFEHLLSLRNDVGLLSEEYDPATKRLVGNFPQAFSHVGLINTAFNLSAHHRGAAAERSEKM